ncbi:BgTH12-01612 [Blumeria graminis f. sp. triticale]|uniref:BgTH12-01612 n=1 Tax=Blumeria graminis f. sp. triticale TaxID=1689686 RepID=A0A9W4D4V4_BLUGR|nr:BgTH12-01612 [Blumeria graminis f. sp. triticale]
MWLLHYFVLLASVSKPAAAASFQKWDIEKGAVCSGIIWTGDELKEVRLRYCDRPPSPASLKNTSHHYRGLFYSDKRTFIYFLPLPQHASLEEVLDIDSYYYISVDADCNFYSVVKLKDLYAGQTAVYESNTEMCTEGQQF